MDSGFRRNDIDGVSVMRAEPRPISLKLVAHLLELTFGRQIIIFTSLNDVMTLLEKGT